MVLDTGQPRFQLISAAKTYPPLIKTIHFPPLPLN